VRPQASFRATVVTKKFKGKVFSCTEAAACLILGAQNLAFAARWRTVQRTQVTVILATRDISYSVASLVERFVAHRTVNNRVTLSVALVKTYCAICIDQTTCCALTAWQRHNNAGIFF
jgi:predicted membrane chloride channel (bestrophin family)